MGHTVNDNLKYTFTESQYGYLVISAKYIQYSAIYIH